MIEISEAAKEIGIKTTKNISGWIKRVQKVPCISLISKNDKVFISEEDLKKLQRNRANNIPYDVEILDGYLTRNEAVKKYQITYSSLRQQEKNGTLKTVKVKGISLLEEKSLKELKNVIEEIESIRKDDKWIKISDLYKKGKNMIKSLLL